MAEPTLDGITVEALAARAAARTGLDDFGGDTWRDGLDRLVWSLRHEAALHELGEAIVVEELVDYLANRLDIVAERSRHPAVAATDVVAPIVIVGQARTGTTILFDLLAQDPEHRVPLTWEVDRPCPPPETATYHDDPRIAAVDEHLAGIDLLLPEFRRMHPMGARLGQECVRITGGEFRSFIFPTQYRVPTYARWVLDEADLAPAYRWHRTYLQHLQSRCPATRWVLKSPGHIWSLGALLAEYPGALLVQTHRDPLRVVASVSSLVATLRSLASADTSVPAAAGEFAGYILDGLDRSVTAREDGTVRPDRVVDVRYRDFVADPLPTIAAIYDRLGLALSAEAEGRMRAFLAAHPQDRHGGHRYTFDATGLDAVEWRARAEHYQAFFEVPSEPLG
ncbi:MAG: sulfotransferase [Acidimicrobiales bacterium]|nr:sulfotransferase [Acidimicrobiales bacterium]